MVRGILKAGKDVKGILVKSEALVIGRGPAGFGAVIELHKEKINTIILEKRTHLENKPCGGLLSKKTLNLFPKLNNIQGNRINKVRFYDYSFNYNELIIEESVGIVTTREELDRFFLKELDSLNANYINGISIEGIHCSKGKYIVHTNKESFNTDYILGCDGVLGYTSKLSDKSNNKGKWQYGVGISTFLKGYGYPQDTISFFINRRIGGMGWIFPTNGILNVGLGSWYYPISSFNKTWNLYLNNICKLFPFEKASSTKGSLLPAGGLRGSWGKGNLLLCGDAASLVDGFSGEGIYQALLSGNFAGRSIYEAMNLGVPAIGIYNKKIKDHLYNKQLLSVISSLLLSTSTALKEKILIFMKEKFEKWMVGIMVGSTDYVDLYKGILVN